MLVRRKEMSWRRVTKSLQAFSAHTLLFCFTLLLVLKLDHLVPCSWWIIFFPLFLFHAVVARGRFSLPAPSAPHGRHWAPFHAIVATPLLIAFELLLCVFLESAYVKKVPAVSLKIVFLPLLAFEITILIDNFRMCKALLPGDDVSLNDEAIWETLPHFWVAISMVFFFAATVFTLLKLCGDVASLGWWDLFINFGIAECFAFLVCTRWSNPMIHRNFIIPEASSSSVAIRYLDWNNGLVVSTDDISEDRMCGLQDIGGHVMKIPIIVFQILLCMCLEGKPAAARFIPLPVVFSPVFLVQGLGVLIAASNLVERIVILLRTGAGTGRYFIYAARARDSFGFLHHGSRLLGWWSTDEGSREEQARLYHHGSSGQVLQSSWVSHFLTHFHVLGWVGLQRNIRSTLWIEVRFAYMLPSPDPTHPRVGYTGFVWFWSSGKVHFSYSCSCHKCTVLFDYSAHGSQIQHIFWLSTRNSKENAEEGSN